MRTARNDMGKALQQFRKGSSDQTQFFQKAFGAQEGESKGLLSKIKEMYGKHLSSVKNEDPVNAAGTASKNTWQSEAVNRQTALGGREVTEITVSGKQIVVNAADVSKAMKSNDQIVIQSPQKTVQNPGIEDKGAMHNGPAVSLFGRSEESEAGGTPLLRTIAPKPGSTDTIAAGPAKASTSGILQSKIQIESPLEKIKDIESPLEKLNDKKAATASILQSRIQIESPLDEINDKADDDDKEDKNVKPAAPGLENKDEKTDENPGIGPVKSEEKKVEKDDDKEEKENPSVALRLVKSKKDDNKPQNIPPGLVKKAEDKPDTKIVYGVDGFGQLKTSGTQALEEIEELLGEALRPDQGRKANRHHQAVNAEPGRVGFKGAVRINTGQGTETRITSGAAIHMRDQAESQNPSISLKNNDFRTMMAQTPIGKNAALSIYRGVQNYVG